MSQQNQKQEIPEGFQEYIDSKTGRKYYYNATTKETKWATASLWEKPTWAQKGNALNNLKKTERGEKMKNGDGNLAAPVTHIRDYMQNK